ncbi:MAG: glycosyltransferase family 2 protein [Bacteroidaceae bacterium]
MSKVLSIIIPAYNEENNVTEMLNRVTAVQLDPIEKEIVIVNDGSSDKTSKKISLFIAEHPHYKIRLVEHTRNQGKGMAIRTALHYVTGDYIIIQDGDLELDPNDYRPLLTCLIDENQKVVYGSRFLSEDGKHLYRRFYWGGRLVSFVANVLFFQHITDEPTCYKLFRAEVLKSINLKCTGFEFCPEVTAKVAKQGIKIKEIPISYNPRTIEEGKKLCWTDGIKAIFTLVKYRFVD